MHTNITIGYKDSMIPSIKPTVPTVHLSNQQCLRYNTVRILYKKFVPNCVTWGMNQRFILYNNKGVISNQTISNTFVYSV